MNSERWQQIEELFHQASELAPDARTGFLDQACASDGELRNQVKALLDSLEESGDFIEESAVAKAASAPAASFIGRTIGHYEVVSLLGAGGMGEVYLAKDPTLDRPIALKILPAQFTADPSQVQRFAREARAASALNHPNIITIHEIGHDAGTHFIATEFIAGETLRGKMTRGKIELREALRIVAQIADALSAAHAARLVHRDIKPENVMVRPDGLVKVLDFGLAKPAEGQGDRGMGGWGDQGMGRRGGREIERFETERYGDEETRKFEEAETREYGVEEIGRTVSPRPPLSPSPHPPIPFFPALPQLTEPGVLMGTIAYLSPEQVRRQEVDPRTDIFSLGVVLYEVVTGVRPFQGNNAAAVCDAILSQPPAPVTKFRPDTPAALGRIIERALMKDRGARYQNAAEMCAELKRLSRTLETGALTIPVALPVSEARPRRSRGWLVVLVAAGLVATAGLAYKFIASRKPAATASPWVASRPVQLTRQSGEELFPSLAPDGQALVYASQAAGNWDIYRQSVSDSAARNLTQNFPENDTHPAFSPDGEWIAFRSERAGGGIFVMNASGEAVRQVTNFGFHPAWSPDGRQLLCTEESIMNPADRTISVRRLWVVGVATGEKRLLSTEDIAQPQWSPHGQRIAYWGAHVNGQRDILTMPAQGGTPTPVTSDAAVDWNPVWSPDGRYLYFTSDRSGRMQLWRVAIDEASGKVLSALEPVLSPTETDQKMIALSRDGRRMVYVTAARTKKNLHRLAFDPEQGVAVGPPVRLAQDPQWLADSDLSPDGQWLVCASTEGQHEHLFIVRSDGSGERRRLTNDPVKDREPVWSPDGKQIAFHSNQSGAWEVWTINADGSGRRQMTYTAQENAMVAVWSPDGARIVYTTRHGLPYAIEVARPWWEQTPQPIGSPATRQAFLPAAWSPDGTQLAGPWQAVANGPFVVAAYSFKTQRFTPLTDGRGIFPLWLNDNRRVLFIRAGKIVLSDPATRQARLVFSAAPHRINSFALSRDNRTIYFSPEENDADLWLLNRD